MEIIEQLKWRYATKKFDSSKKLSDKDLQFILEATNLSASSYGLQPYHILLIEDSAIREQLKKAAHGQIQLTDASQVIVFAAKTNLSDSDVEEYVKLIAETRNIPVESLQQFDAMMKGSISGLSPEQKTTWAAKQTYIALGQLLTVCAISKIDACPMEGFDKAAFDEILGLKEKNLTSTVIAPIGYRSECDDYQHYPKVRRPLKEMIIKY